MAGRQRRRNLIGDESLISVELLADSASLTSRLTTFRLVYPAMIHAEIMTHRSFSRNASSSRAITTPKMIASVLKDPAMPVAWRQHQKGMQAGPDLATEEAEEAEKIWLTARDSACAAAAKMYAQGVSKEITNRVLAPWLHMHVILSATDFDNFFKLRVNKMAQPEMQSLALEMLKQYMTSIPKKLNFGEWHSPFPKICLNESLDTQLKVAAAHCARVSYNSDKQFSIEDDLELFDRLTKNGHLSPLEHVAQVSEPGYHANFNGFLQLRREYESMGKINLCNLLDEYSNTDL